MGEKSKINQCTLTAHDSDGKWTALPQEKKAVNNKSCYHFQPAKGKHDVP